ncbi:uncharacterized protein [Heptranchias perlo]|uniref:uncharacterized protein n=1 Tax=Heptranchias perlo TaxID=212740 RepID=UPI00355A9EC0
MEVKSTSPHKRLLLIIQQILLLPHLATAGETEDFKVTQHPPAVNISEGDPVTMTCSWNTSQGESVRVDWLKDNISIFTKNGKGEYRPDKREYIIEGNYSNLIIPNTVLNDSGLYHCEVFVEIPPPVRRASGEGSLLLVFDKANEAQAKTDMIIWLLAAISPTMLIVIIAVCCCLRKAKNRRQNGIISNLRRSFRLHAKSVELTEIQGKMSQTKASSVYENSSVIKKEAREQKKKRSSWFYVNSTELSLASQKIEDKSDNIYKNISDAQQGKHQSMNKVIEEKSPS